MSTGRLKDFSWERMIAAVDAVRERACRIAAALARAGIPHAVVGGNAVAAWVARVDVEREDESRDGVFHVCEHPITDLGDSDAIDVRRGVRDHSM